MTYLPRFTVATTAEWSCWLQFGRYNFSVDGWGKWLMLSTCGKACRPPSKRDLRVLDIASQAVTLLKEELPLEARKHFGKGRFGPRSSAERKALYAFYADRLNAQFFAGQNPCADSNRRTVGAK